MNDSPVQDEDVTTSRPRARMHPAISRAWICGVCTLVIGCGYLLLRFGHMHASANYILLTMIIAAPVGLGSATMAFYYNYFGAAPLKRAGFDVLMFFAIVVYIFVTAWVVLIVSIFRNFHGPS